MFKRDDYIRSKPDAVFSNWQGFARSMLLRKPLSETQGLTKTIHDYSLISHDLGSKILIGANGKENFRKGKDRVDRFRVRGSNRGLSELGLAVINHDQGGEVVPDSQVESFRYRLRPIGRRAIAQHDLLKKLGDSEISVLPFTSKEIGNRTKDKKHDSVEERDLSCDAGEKQSDFLASVHRLTRSRPQMVSDRHDDVFDGSDSASLCGVLLEDGTACTITPIQGRKRCAEHKGQRLSRASPEKHTLFEVPIGRECEETENICGVILPDMVPCRRKPVSRRKRCEDHKGMRTNAFFFLMNPTERDKIVKENKSKPETCTSSMNKENDSDLSLLCEATTKNGLPCTRNAPKGSRRCWQHKDKTSDHESSRNVQSGTVSQVMCGVKLYYNGSVCEEAPVKGRKRCEEHKGMRITS